MGRKPIKTSSQEWLEYLNSRGKPPGYTARTEDQDSETEFSNTDIGRRIDDEWPELDPDDEDWPGR